MLLMLIMIYRRETRHVYSRHDRFTGQTCRVPADVTRHTSYSQQSHPPAKGGSTSMTAPSSSIIDSLAARPTGSAFTRKDDRAMTSASRLSGFLLATTASSTSRRVTASTDSSGNPAASLAAAQYLMITLDI